MRKLQTRDVFNALRLIKKADLKEQLKPVIALAAEGELKVDDIGIEGMLTVIEIFSAAKSEQAIYEFLAEPFEMTPEEVGGMDLGSLTECFDRLAKENDLKNFFTILQGLITKK